MSRLAAPLALLAGLLLAGGAARANGFSHADNGTVPLGRGGAFTARASA